jgi:hypothetical protein
MLNSCSLSISMLTPGSDMGSSRSVKVGDARDSQEGFPEASDMGGLRGYLLSSPPCSFYARRGHLLGVSGGKLPGAVEQTPDPLAPRCRLLRSSPST